MTDVLLTIVRRRLIERFKADQASVVNYLSFSEAAEKWAYLRNSGATITEKKEHAISDLMEAAFDGIFPELIWLVPEASVELLPVFDRKAVEEIASELNAKTGKIVDLWAEPENTALMTPEKFALLRTGLGLREINDRYLREKFKDCLWAPKQAVIDFLKERGVELSALPTDWRGAPAEKDERQVSPDKTSENWNARDVPHFQKMRGLLDSGRALSVADAAQKVVKDGNVAGYGSRQSIEKRLARGFSRWQDA